MDVETFFGEIKESAINLMAKELQDLDLVKVQTITWIRFKVEVEDEDGSVARVETIDKECSSQMMEVFQGSDLSEVMNGMLVHMRMQVKNPPLMNGRFMFLIKSYSWMSTSIS